MTGPIYAWNVKSDPEQGRKQAGVWTAKITVDATGLITMIDLFGSKRVRIPKWKRKLQKPLLEFGPMMSPETRKLLKNDRHWKEKR